MPKLRLLLFGSLLVLLAGTGLLSARSLLAHPSVTGASAESSEDNSSRDGSTSTGPLLTSPSSTTQAPRLVQFHTIDKGWELGGYNDPTDLVINNQTAWSRVWSIVQAACVEYCDTAPPSVDFGSRTVIAVFYGLAGNGGHQIEITRVEQMGQTVTVFVKVTDMGARCMSTQMMNYPLYIVDIPKTDQVNIRFVTETSIANCA